MKNKEIEKKSLIIDLLQTYQFYCIGFNDEQVELKTIYFDGYSYKICPSDYDVVCKIIDCIKGVK